MQGNVEKTSAAEAEAEAKSEGEEEPEEGGEEPVGDEKERSRRKRKLSSKYSPPNLFIFNTKRKSLMKHQLISRLAS